MNLEAKLGSFPLCGLEEKRVILCVILYWCNIMDMTDYPTVRVNID